MKLVIVRPPFCRSADDVFCCVLMNLIIGAQHVTKEDGTLIYLIVADVRRPLYDANKCWFPFVVISFVFSRSGLEVGFEANCRCMAVTDRYTGAILTFGTGLLTVFLNREVTVLPGLTSYSLLWEIIWD